jgi:hypothetical protein
MSADFPEDWKEAGRRTAPWSMGLEAANKAMDKQIVAAFTSPDMEETNGGRHSQLGMDFFRIPPKALKVLASILHTGAAAHQDDSGENWRQIPCRIHMNHALYHMNEWNAGNSDEDHLGHALTRLAMAAETR